MKLRIKIVLLLLSEYCYLVLFPSEMQFQGMDISPSPDQELAHFPDRSSTVFPITPAASKLTLPASRFAPLPPIETEHFCSSHKDALMSLERDEHQHAHLQHLPVKTFGQATGGESTAASRGVGQGRTLVPQDEGVYKSKELRAGLDQDHITVEGRDQKSLSKGRNDEATENQRTTVKERMLTLDM